MFFYSISIGLVAGTPILLPQVAIVGNDIIANNS